MIPARTRAEADEQPLPETAANQEARERLQALVAALARQVCTRGWYGKVSLTFTVQDGTIQHMLTTDIQQQQR